MAVVEANSITQLDDIIARAGNAKIVVVDFTATWCGPCQMMAPHMYSLAQKHVNKAVFVKVDVDQAKEVALKYQVRSMPTFFFFHKGQVVEQLVGAQPAKLSEVVERLVQLCNPFSGHGFTLGGTSPAPSASSHAAGGRRNPWADPNFVPPYMRNLKESTKPEHKENPKSSARSSAPQTPWSNADFKPAPVPSQPSTAPAAAADGADDADLAAAIAMSLEESPASNTSDPAVVSINDPALTKNLDQKLLSNLVDMGFPILRAEKALILTQAKNLEDATNWLVEHADDADIDEPLSVVKPESGKLPAGAPLGVKPGAEFEDNDDLTDAMRNLRRQAEKDKKKVKELTGVTKPVHEMTKEEKLQYIEKLKEVKRIQKESNAVVEKREREQQRQKNAKEAIEAQQKREEARAKMAAARAKRERDEEKERRRRIKEKLKQEKEARIRERQKREQQKAQQG